ncbi:hypothetical protein BVRB_7g164340 [Beta vulgaris subsp. vulgaris]|nr:hypothetical protein BVRB_7g164340 [Beta vulgaris subsp. vulgaris]
MSPFRRGYHRWFLSLSRFVVLPPPSSVRRPSPPVRSSFSPYLVVLHPVFVCPLLHPLSSIIPFPHPLFIRCLLHPRLPCIL